MFVTTAVVLMLGACGDDASSTSDAAADARWEPLSDDTLHDGGEDSGKSDGESCGAEVIEGATCQGHWSETMCVDEQGVWWWCEDSVWTSDKDE